MTLTPCDSATAELIATLLAEGGFSQMRQLDDGSLVAIGKLLFTTAVYIDVERYGWGKRFCFSDPQLALKEYEKITSSNDEPQGYIARRP